jgi:hypothetical protein
MFVRGRGKTAGILTAQNGRGIDQVFSAAPGIRQVRLGLSELGLGLIKSQFTIDTLLIPRSQDRTSDADFR